MGFKKVRIATDGVNQREVDRYVDRLENQGTVVWRDEPGMIEVDGVSEAEQEQIKSDLEALGRHFKPRRRGLFG